MSGVPPAAPAPRCYPLPPMARRPTATLGQRPLSSAHALVLALLLLLTQQWGLLHGLAHGLSGRDMAALGAPVSASVTTGAARATSAADVADAGDAAGAPDDAPAAVAPDALAAEGAAEAWCGTCLVLSGLGALAAPAPLVWAAAAAPAVAPGRPGPPTWRAAAATPFLARAPPALPVPA